MTQTKNNATVGLVLFHNDLRVHDNATLLKAATSCHSLLLVYCPQTLLASRLHRGQAYLSGTNRQNQCMGKAKQQFLYQSLAALNQQLNQLGNELLIINGSANGISHFERLKTLIHSYKVTHVFVSHTADYDQKQAYQLLAQQLPTLQWHFSTTTTLFDAMPTPHLPKVFSQFRKYIEHAHPKRFDLLTAANDVLISPTPSHLPTMPLISTDHSATQPLFIKFNELNQFNEVSPQLNFSSDPVIDSPFTGGEQHALTHVAQYFDSTNPQTYKQTRNALALCNLAEDQTAEQADGDVNAWSHTTRFSPWLANGSLSVRVLLNRLRQYQQQTAANESTYWIWFELLWREYFYWYGEQHGKRLFCFSGIKKQKPKTSFYAERFERWKHGSTPYPIVNACMKQLKATGYMSNRGRQLVASCFVHELGLDWRYGASYFEQQLIDYDVTSNWGNWQYLAGVGADPRGNRQFNLAKQTQQYDPQQAFIKKWQGDIGNQPIDSVDIADWYI